MTRTVGALSTHLSGTAHTRCNMLLMGLRDGTFYGITDHDANISYNLTEAGAGSIVYNAHGGTITSDITLAVGMDADNYEVVIPIGGTVSSGVLLLSGDMTDGDDELLLSGDMTDGDDALFITQDIPIEAFLGGRLNRADTWLFQVNWKSTGDGKIPFMKGNVSELRIEGGRAVLQIRAEVDRLNQVIGRLISPYCDADHGDARCGRVPESVVGTVSAVASALQFTVTFSGSFADDYFNLGVVEALTGDLAGTAPVEIWDWTSGGAITLFTELSEAPAVGDTFDIIRGCGKTRLDCMARANIVNFRGFPEVPGTDQVLKVPVPGT